jgi:hypothetical protein
MVTPLARIATASAVLGGVVVIAANPAQAATTYYVQGTDGSLAVQSWPYVNHVVGWLGEGAAVHVVCQINTGGTDPYDNLNSRTWDLLTSGNWVYDWYVSTPVQGSDGYSPGVPHCGLTNAIGVPGLPIGGIQAYGYTAGPLFKDGFGFTNANRAESLASAEASGFCQDLVMANTDFSWLWPDINYVARWPGDAWSNGRTVTSYPIVGAVVVFRPGNHYWSSTHYWNYGDGHVAMVVAVDSISYTVAEFNFNLGGGGRYIMDFRRIPWPDPYPTWGDGPSVAGFIR